jgi:phosphate transport system protein
MRYRLVRRDLLEMLSAIRGFPTPQNDDRHLQRISLLLSMAHILERIADQCVHICEWVVFVFEGDASMTSAH